MLPLETVYAFDPVPPEPQHEESATAMSRSGDVDSDGSAMDVEAASSGNADGGSVSATPAYADSTLPASDAHHIIVGQARTHMAWHGTPFAPMHFLEAFAEHLYMAWFVCSAIVLQRLDEPDRFVHCMSYMMQFCYAGVIPCSIDMDACSQANEMSDTVHTGSLTVNWHVMGPLCSSG